MTVKKEDLEKRLTYTLIKPATFEGNVYKQDDIDAGVDLELTEEQALDLIDRGVIEQPLED